MRGNITNADIDLIMKIAEAIVFKIIVLNNSTLVRPKSDKIPIISQSENKVTITLTSH